MGDFFHSHDSKHDSSSTLWKAASLCKIHIEIDRNEAAREVGGFEELLQETLTYISCLLLVCFMYKEKLFAHVRNKLSLMRGGSSAHEIIKASLCLLFLQAGYTVHLFKTVEWKSMPKNDVIVGYPSEQEQWGSLDRA